MSIKLIPVQATKCTHSMDLLSCFQLLDSSCHSFISQATSNYSMLLLQFSLLTNL
uniref:Uncharacterized protein n=1 Tax=Arundo donax TaxID=35708 RepID=A0A0A9HFW6_ARUDO